VVESALRGELPANLDGKQVLEVVHASDLEDQRVGSFDFILCRDLLRTSPHPMALLASLWRLAAPGGVLLLEAAIDPDPAHSGYARFVPTASSGTGWVPGRLALRWMVEVSGFDVERWLSDPAVRGDDSRARLRAVRAEREPARSAP
jgi:SAM-dependent methyltransferase